MDEGTVLEKKGITVINEDNREVKGRWKVSHGGTKFTFTPDQLLHKNKLYKIKISSEVKDKAGTKLGKEKTVQFKVMAK